jgi:hypothetical protein
MADAVATRVNALQAALARTTFQVGLGNQPMGSHIPPGLGWYGEHQQAYREASERTGTRIGSLIDAGAVASARNTPEKERLAAESAGYIAANPDRKVTITDEMAPHMGNPDIKPGEHRIGTGRDGDGLSDEDVAHIGYAETQALKGLGHVNKQGNALSDKRFTPREFTGVTLDSAGRDVGAKVVAVARGKTFDEVTKGATPKTRNFSRATHLMSREETAYNSEVLRRIASVPTFVEGDGKGGTNYSYQEHLFSPYEKTAAEIANFDPSTADESVEDYVMNEMSAHVAASKGKTGKTAREAQEIVKPPKGKNVFDPSFDPEEMRHAFNEESTRRAAMQIGIAGESLTTRGAQAISWVERRRHTLGEDKEYNKAQKQLAKDAKKASKAKEKAPTPPTVTEDKGPTPEERGQLTLF